MRKAGHADLKAVVEILNHGVKTRHSVGYFQSQDESDMQAWFDEHILSKRYPIFVAEENNKIVGWISISPYRKGREAFNRTGEISAYIHEDHQALGIAQKLLDKMLEFAVLMGFRIIFAVVLDKNVYSIKLLEKNNFQRWAMLPEVAEIDGILLNHIYFGKKLDQSLWEQAADR